LITKVWERLYIGGLKDAERLNADNQASITTVVSLCPEVLPKAEGITYVKIPIADAQQSAIRRGHEDSRRPDQPWNSPACLRGWNESVSDHGGGMDAPQRKSRLRSRHATHRRTSAND
jgi:hypothetical protein